MDGYVTIECDLDTKSFEKQIKEVERELKEIDYELSHAKELKLDKRTIEEYQLKAEKLNNQLTSLYEKQNALNRTDFSKITNNITKVIKKVSKWALAVFGIRSAYMAVRNAINVISGQDEQLKADIDYIKTALAYALEPIVRRIVDLAKQLLYFIASVVKFLTGRNILEETNKGLKGANSQAKELKKTLAGFDEMNIINDTSSAGGGGIDATPDFDPSKVKDLSKTIEELQQKWADLGEEMRKNLYDMPFSQWTDAFGAWDLAIYGVIQTIHGLWSLIDSFGQMVSGIIEIITGLVTGDTAMIQVGFQDFFGGLWGMIKSTVEIVVGILNIIKGVIKGLIQTLLGWLFDFINVGVEKINGFVSKITTKLTEFRDKVKKTIEDIKAWLTEKFGVIGTVIGEVIGFAFRGVVNGVLRIIENILNTPIRAINGLINSVNKLPGVNIKNLQTFSLPRLAKGGIVNMPGRGVPVGSAIAGERGAEGVIPLTDSQQMALLGEAIGKYITINAQMNNYMDGRLISRQLEKIRNQQNFIMNR